MKETNNFDATSITSYEDAINFLGLNEIKVSTENVHKAFHAASENPEIQELLINLFGKENVEPEQSKDVKERIKTFEDAYNELGEEHPYCIAFDSIYQDDSVIPSLFLPEAPHYLCSTKRGVGASVHRR